MKNLKRNILLSLVLLLVTSTYATNLYWIGGTGNWNDAKHWSLTSGGLSGNIIPTSNDDVYFDQNSFTADKQTVKVITNAVCRNIDWSSIDDKAIFSAAASRNIQVYGSYILSPLLNNGFKGQTIFSSQQNGNTLKTTGSRIIGDLVFDGTGSWALSDNITAEENVSIKLLQGSLSTNGKAINCGYFNGNSSKPRALNLSSSQIIVNKLWDCSSPTNLSLSPGTSSILLKDIVDNSTFRSGGLLYNDVGVLVTFCVPSGTLCVANIIITISAINITCNGLCNGSATVVSVSGGCGGPYSYDWQGALTPTGDGTNTITGLCAGNYTVKVTDGCGSFCFCNINVTEPSVLFGYELFNTPASCNGICDGVIGVDATGGTFPYTYFWTLGSYTNDTVSVLCAGSYTILVTDANGCTGSTTVVATEPAVLLSPGSSTDVTCNGFCNGTASVVASGGTGPGTYTYDWTLGTPTGDGTANITNLCPGSYTCTVTDTNACTSTYVATIIQPPVLTLTMSQVNATCGGTCDGSATATITGGTPPYNYVWSNGSSTLTGALSNTISGLCAGSYTVDVTDANGCLISNSVTITEPPVLVATASGTNVTCFSLCNGTATVVVVGGNSGNTFDWAPNPITGDGTASVTNLCPGTYTVTVTDVNGCNDTGVVVITEPAILASNPVGTNVFCFGACNGSATSTPTGGTLPYSWDWTPGAPVGDGTATITSLCPNTYTVTVTDGNGCTNSQSVTITQPPILSAGATSTNVTCNGACNGTATSTPTGGTPGYTFLWMPGSLSTPTISGLCPGSYTVTVTDLNGCTNSQTVVITQPNLLTVSIVSTTLACNGDCNATATATITGGTPLYTIDWTPGTPIGDGGLTISSLCAGTYTVTITDLNGCTATASTTILQPTALTLTTAVTDVSCFGLCNGVAAAIAGGGTPGYLYSWAPGGQITSSISGQCAGSYTVTVTDLNGCTMSDTVTITQPNQLFANPFVVSNISCAGVIPCDGSASSAPTGGTGGTYTYNWTPGTPAGDGTPTITALCAGTYNLTVTDSNSCTSTMPVTIIQPLVLMAPITGSASSCNICNGTATVTPSGGTPGYSYSWNTIPVQNTQTAVGLCPNTTYMVTVTDLNGCVATATVTILQTITIAITTSNTTLSCFGACDGIVTANAGGGTLPYSFIWTGPVCGGPVGIVSLTATAAGLGAGTYTVNVTDAAGCFNTDSITFINPPLLTVSTVSSNATCAGVCDGTATGTVAGGTITYSWNTVPVQNTATAAGLCAGTYTLTATDSSGCTALDTVVITEPPLVVDNVTITPANCTFADGSITVVPTGGTGVYAYDWNGAGTPTGDGTATITGLVPGVYTLAITSGACTYNFSYLLSNILGPTTTMSHTDVTCFGDCDGTASVLATGGAGGYIYDWTPGAPTGDGTDSITALCGTITYTVQVTDAAGCITFDLDTVTNPALISPNPVVVNESCGGACDGSISLFPTGGTGGYFYLWTGGTTSSSITGLCAGAYTFTVTDANGCDSTLTITIVSPPPLGVTLSSTNVLCNSACDGTATAGVFGGTGPGTYTYVWSHGGAFILPNVVGLCPGSYTVDVTDGNGCTASDTVIITEPTALTTTTLQDNVTCFGLCDGIAIVIPSGGTAPYAYSWNTTPIQTNDSAMALCPGSYTAIVTDSNGCVSSPPPVVITEPSPIVPNAVGVNPLCNNSCNGTATATPTGGSGTYTYSWNSVPGQITQTAVGLCAGTYTVTVDDGFCSSTQSVTLTDPAVLNANASATSPTCVGDCDGSVTSNPIGGTGPIYTYSWTPGPFATQTVINLCPNVYTLIVNDQNGCADTQAVTLATPLGIDVIIGSTPAACGVCDGTISLTPITGTGPYTFVWTDSSGGPPPGPFAGNGTANVTGVCAGLYDVLVTDSNGCDSLFTIPMNNSSGPTSVITSSTNASCPGVCDGSASIDTVIGGTPLYTFLWNDPAATINDTAFNLCDSTYFIIITDAAGCIFIPSIIITEPAPIVPNEVITLALCSNICTGAIEVAPTGGTGPYTYFWTSGVPGVIVGQGTDSVSSLCAGTYTVTITDSNLCVQVDSFVVGQSTPLTATIGVTNISCSSSCSGMAYVTISSGTGPYTIQWNDPSGQTNDTATALCAGTYTVSITDALGCTLSLDTTITATPAVSANAVITDATCNLCDGFAVLAPTGGTGAYTFVWSNGDNTATGDSLCAGLYTVDITDAVGCVTSVSIPVSNPSGPTSATIVSTNLVCNGVCSGSVASITPVGGTAPYTFLWIASGLTTPTLSSLCAGTYFVQITDANGCSLMDSVVITEPAPILANQVIVAATCGLCDGSITIAPSGGTGPYTVLWNTGSTALSLINLCAGVYSVDITDAAGCVQTLMIPLNSQSGPTVKTFPTDVPCSGDCIGIDSAYVTGLSPFSYLWNDVGLQTTSVATSLCAGTYFVQVTDAAGCVTIASSTISEPDSIGFSVANTLDPLCNGNANGTITVIPSGGTLSYTYSWTPTSQTTATAIGLDANTYIVAVTDANGCTATQTVTLINPTSLTISNTFIPSSCNTIPDGSIDVTVGGGTLPYAYVWTGLAATTEDLTGILSGTYTITVIDSNSCTIADTIILLPAQTVIADAGNDTSFCLSGSITLDASASINGTTYQWFDMAGTLLDSSVILTFNPPAGTNSFYVVVDNGTGCSDNDTIDITENPLPNASAGTDVIIVIGMTTPIGGSPTSTSAGVTYQWSPTAALDNATISNPTANPTTTTTYTVTVTTAQGCTAVDSVIVEVRPTIIFPDGISPNGDGANDEWIIDGIELFPNCEVEVYNRWGELLFQSVGYKETWKGTFKGQDLPVGTYYYVIDLKDELYPDAYTGPITIMR